MEKKSFRPIWLALVVFAISVCFGAGKKYRYHGMKLVRVEIVVPGDLFSTYGFTEGENVLVKQAVGGDEALFAEIEKCHLEDCWPDPINNFIWRIGHPDVIKQLAGYKLCNLEGDRCLLVIPQSKNTNVSQISWEHDIYFVIRQTGIK